MKRTCFHLVCLVMALLLIGCTSPRGIIYKHITKPLDLNLDKTPSEESSEEGDIKHFSYSVVDVMWDSNAIGDIARREGIENIYYVDEEIFSILGIWNQYTVHVYGR